MGFFDKIKSALTGKEREMSGGKSVFSRLFLSGHKAMELALNDIDEQSKRIENMRMDASIAELANNTNSEVGRIAQSCITRIVEIKQDAKELVDKKADDIKTADTSVKTFKNYCELQVEFCKKTADDIEHEVNAVINKTLQDIKKEQAKAQKAPAVAEAVRTGTLDKSEVSRMAGAGKTADEIEREAEDKEKQAQFKQAQKGMKDMSQNLVTGVSQFGHAKEVHPAANSAAKAANAMDNISKSEIYNEYLKTIPLSTIAEVNTRVQNVNKNFQHIATGQELLLLVKSAEKVTRDLDEKLELKQAEMERITKTYDKLKGIYGNGKVVDNPGIDDYAIVDMNRLGIGRDYMEKNLLVMFDKDGKVSGDKPAAVVIDKASGQIFEYDSFEACDKAFGVGLSDPEKKKALDISADIQNHEGVVLNEGVYDAEVNEYYGRIEHKEQNANLDAKVSVAAYMGEFIKMSERIKGDAERSYEDAVRATANAKISNYTITEAYNAVNVHEREAKYSPYKQDFDYVRDTESEVMKKLNPVIEQIKAGLEAADAGKPESEMSYLTANGLVDTGRPLMDEEGRVLGFSHVTVLSASDDHGHTVSMVFDNISGEMTAAYYSNSMLVANDVVLGNCIATKDHVDYSIIANVKEVRDFMEKYPVIQQMVRDCGDNTKDFESRGLKTMEDMQYHVDEIEGRN